MDRYHSTLELVKHYENARAPERDRDAIAFELDASASGPQAVSGTEPQVLYNISSSKVHSIKKSTKERAPSLHISKPTFKRSLMIAVLVFAVTIAIGVKVGFGVTASIHRIGQRRRETP